MGASGGGAGLGARGHGGSAVVPQALAPSATRDVQDATIGQRELRGDVVVGRVAFMQGAVVGGLVGGALSGGPAFVTAQGVIASLTLRHAIAFPSAGRIGLAAGGAGRIAPSRQHKGGPSAGGHTGLLHALSTADSGASRMPGQRNADGNGPAHRVPAFGAQALRNTPGGRPRGGAWSACVPNKTGPGGARCRVLG